MKTIIGLAIGIILAAAIIIPLGNARTQAELETQRTQTALETAQAEIETLKAAQPSETEPLAEIEEPQEIDTLSAEITMVEEEIEVEVAPFPEPEKVEVKAETTPKQTYSPQVQPSEYPKEFYIDGQKYAYLTAYAEEMDYKTIIADESEPNVTAGEVYDWESDPLKDIPGPFTGNGGN
jgi:type II secretory pathway pseudopilin PulG